VDAVILEDGSLEAALGLLDGQTARAAILPADTLTPGSVYNPVEGSDALDILGSAAKLVRAPVELQPAVELLLGRVVVARDRKSARRFLSAHAGEDPNLRVVSLQGEVFFASGQVLAGQGGKAGTLSRPRERRELQGTAGRARNTRPHI
jgi:chromosome segregation ATPase